MTSANIVNLVYLDINVQNVLSSQLMFSQTSEYALRVVVYLASLDGKLATIPQIAQATRTPEGYLAKVLRSLALAELLRSQRGPQGGSVLARPAKQITV